MPAITMNRPLTFENDDCDLNHKKDLLKESDHTALTDWSDSVCSFPSSSGGKQLRFQDDDPHVIAYLPYARDMDEEDRKRLWWDYRDYEGFSKTAFGISKEVRRRPSLTNGLDQAYQKAKKFSMDLSDEERTQELMNQLSLDSGLAQWCIHGHSRRGLEKTTSRLHWSYRGEGPLTAAQQLIVSQSKRLDDSQLRFCSEDASRTARIFAVMMGRADAVAAQALPTKLMRRWSDQGYTTENVQQMTKGPRYPRTSSM